MTRLILGPFNRVEGDLEVQLEVAEGRVLEARVNAPMYRGFEGMLNGRDPMDALTIAPRICGICSVSQSVAAARALADASGVVLPLNGQTWFYKLMGDAATVDRQKDALMKFVQSAKYPAGK